jgi:4-hydroxy 2-oxovalerate aldolase
LIQAWNTVDILYFADSLGNMAEQSIADTIQALKKGWNGALGLHAHNNMGKANSNSLAALDLGVSWIDVTITGMGRGAGNAQSEILLSDLNHSNITGFDGEPLYQVVLDYFEPMQKKLGWGMNFAYHYSAIHNIHPSYTQELLSDPRYDSKDVVDSLAFLARNNSTSFDSSLVDQAFVKDEQHEINGGWNASAWCKDEDILILGSGPSLGKYAKAIESFIASKRIKALSLNLHKEISDTTIYAYVAADAKRLALDIKRYQDIQKPMFLPRRFIPSSITSELNLLDIRDYDLSVSSGHFSAMNTGCELPYQLSIAYAISLCIAGGANRIFLAGFDGYGAEDKRQIDMVNTFEIIKNSIKPEQIISLTPTNYPITQGSIYAPY